MKTFFGFEGDYEKLRKTKLSCSFNCETSLRTGAAQCFSYKNHKTSHYCPVLIWRYKGPGRHNYGTSVFHSEKSMPLRSVAKSHESFRFPEFFIVIPTQKMFSLFFCFLCITSFANLNWFCWIFRLNLCLWYDWPFHAVGFKKYQSGSKITVFSGTDLDRYRIHYFSTQPPFTLVRSALLVTRK